MKESLAFLGHCTKDLYSRTSNKIWSRTNMTHYCREVITLREVHLHLGCLYVGWAGTGLTHYYREVY